VAAAILSSAAVVSRADVPPPTPVPPSGSPSPFPTALHTPPPSDTRPGVHAAAAILVDLGSGQAVFEKKPDMRLPIASLTKLMTAVVVLRSVKLSRVVTVSSRAAATGGSELGLEPGERRTVRDLLYALLLQSSNDAAMALAEGVAGSVEAFVQRMNDRADALGLRNSRFSSPNGLDDRGYSTANDLAALTRAAFGYPAFAEISSTKSYVVPASGEPDRHIQNRNALLWLYRGAVGVKTGFTTPAGHCLVAAARRGVRGLVAVVLGEPTEDRMFDDAATLLNYGFAGFRNVDLIDGGGEAGTITVQGRPVYVVAGSGLTKLIPARAAGAVQVRIVAAPGLRLPIEAGTTVGRVVFLGRGAKLGSVVALAGETVTQPPPKPSPGRGGPPTSRPSPVVNLVGVLVRAALGGMV